MGRRRRGKAWKIKWHYGNKKMQIEKRKQLTMSDFLDSFMKAGVKADVSDIYRLRASFDLYRKPSDDPITKDMMCWADDCVTGNDDNEDVYPEFSRNNGLEFFYSGELFIDVILSVLDQVEDPGTDTLIKALNYYDDNDDFLDIET